MNNSDLKFEHVYNELITQILNVVSDIAFTLAIIMFPFVMYIIVTQSTKEMRGFKWQCVYYMFFSYGMEIMYSIWKPIYLFPTSFVFSIGWTSYLGPTGGFIQYKILYFFDINMIFANYLSVAYRLVFIFGGYEFTFFKQPKYFYLTAASLFIIIHTFIYIPLFFTHFSLSNDQVNEILAKDWPALMQNLSKFSSLFGYSKNDWAYNLHIYSIWLILVSLVLTIFGLEIYMIPYLTKMKKIRSDDTFKLQLMIYKALNLQTLLNAIIIVAVGTWYTSSYIFQIKYGGPVTMAWFYFSICHPVFDSILLLYYIKPYRFYVKKKFERISLFFRSKPLQIVTVAPMPVSDFRLTHAPNIR